MYKVYLGDIEFPIAPKTIETKVNGNNKSVVLVNEGEINLLKSPKLTDVKVQLRIPHKKLKFTENLQSVEYYLNLLEIYITQKIPVQFIVLRKWKDEELYTSNLTVSVEDYNIIEDADNGRMTIIDIDLKQYNDYGDIKATIEEKSVNGNKVLTVQTEKSRLDTRIKPKKVTAVRGDNLWKIAKRHLGDGSKYQMLAQLNNLDNPNGIFQGGEVIRLE